MLVATWAYEINVLTVSSIKKQIEELWLGFCVMYELLGYVWPEILNWLQLCFVLKNNFIKVAVTQEDFHH